MGQVRRHAGLIVAGGLLLLLGALVLFAGRTAANRAVQEHRADRLVLQGTLAGLTDQYVRLSAVEVADRVGATAGTDVPSWSSAVDDPGTIARLRDVVEDTRALDAGALLVDPNGRRLAAWSVDGKLPEATDPGWAPLRAAVLGGGKTLPLSGVLSSTGTPLLAMGLPVQLEDGRRALVIGLWKAADSPLQSYTADLAYGLTGHGYVLDAAGSIIAGGATVKGTRTAAVLRTVTDARATGVGEQAPALLEADEASTPMLASFARVGQTSWTAVTVQNTAEFEGALVRAGARVQVLVAGLLLMFLVVLGVLHRSRMREVQISARRDDLTGLLNRRGWMLQASQELERARRQQTRRLLVFLDLDGLKAINDTLGHREGDRALLAAADVLREVAGPDDVVGRLGGDEFVLLLGDEDPDDVRRRVNHALLARNNRAQGAFEVRMSVGAQAWVPTAGQTLDDLVRLADDAMYQDKLSRVNRAEGVVRLPRQRSTVREQSLLETSGPATRQRAGAGERGHGQQRR